MKTPIIDREHVVRRQGSVHARRQAARIRHVASSPETPRTKSRWPTWGRHNTPLAQCSKVHAGGPLACGRYYWWHSNRRRCPASAAALDYEPPTSSRLRGRRISMITLCSQISFVFGFLAVNGHGIFTAAAMRMKPSYRARQNLIQSTAQI
jgi:hypothetical protein